MVQKRNVTLLDLTTVVTRCPVLPFPHGASPAPLQTVSGANLLILMAYSTLKVHWEKGEEKKSELKKRKMSWKEGDLATVVGLEVRSCYGFQWFAATSQCRSHAHARTLPPSPLQH